MSTDFREVSIDLIQPNPVALRSVNRSNEQFLNLVKDVKRRGVVKPLVVREKHEEATNESYFELCDGLQRFSAAQDAGLTVVPVVVRDLTDDQVEEEQIALNLVKVDTRPIEYANQLRRMLQRNPTMTEAELAEKISQSPSFVRNRLSLHNLTPGNQKLVEEGSIGLANAYALAKLPAEKQGQFADAAMTKPPGEFVEEVNKYAKELRDAAREGRAPADRSFQPKAKARKVAEIESEISSGAALSAVFAAAGVTTVEEAGRVALQWAIRLDRISVDTQKAEYEADEAARKAEKAKKDIAKKELARRDAAAKAAAAAADSGLQLSDAELDELVKAQAEADAKAAADRAAKKAEKEAAAAAAGETAPAEGTVEG